MTIPKTYKLFINGQFPRTESGRVLEIRDQKGGLIANASRASRKDFREAVSAARKSLEGWKKTTAYLRGQILYRIAEVLQGRKGQFVDELRIQGVKNPESDVDASIDLLVYYAGWSDKYQSVFSSVNPVSSAHFNFSSPVPVGVVSVISPSSLSLLSLVSVLVPIIVGANTCVILSHLSSISFAEVLATSDVPAGVVNLLTGQRAELVGEFARHMDVNSTLLCSDDQSEIGAVERDSISNLKRLVIRPDCSLEPSPYPIIDFQEDQTTWHPIGV